MKPNAWIVILAYEARLCHAADRRRDEEMAARLAAVRSRALADLRHAIALDIDRYLREVGDQRGSAQACLDGSGQGFVVSFPNDAIGTRTLRVALKPTSFRCSCDRCDDVGGASREVTVEIGPDGSLSVWDAGLVQNFVTVEALSAFLLAPIVSTAEDESGGWAWT